MKKLAIKQSSRKSTKHQCGNPDDFIDSVESLKKLHGMVTLLTSLGSPDREVYDTGHILRFCELIEDQLLCVIQDLEVVQEAYSSNMSPEEMARAS